MPIIHQIRTDLKLAISTHVGLIPDDEFLASYQDLLSMEAFKADFNQLIDLRQTESHKRSSEALQAIARLFAVRCHGMPVQRKTAIIAPSNLSFGLSRMYEVFASAFSGEFVVFRAADAALAWLALPPGTIPV